MKILLAYTCHDLGKMEFYSRFNRHEAMRLAALAREASPASLIVAGGPGAPSPPAAAQGEPIDGPDRPVISAAA